jgi:hypothetical protein
VTSKYLSVLAEFCRRLVFLDEKAYAPEPAVSGTHERIFKKRFYPVFSTGIVAASEAGWL